MEYHKATRNEQAQLLKQARNGNKEAANQLAQSIWPWAIRVAARTTHNLDHDQVNSAVNLAITKAINKWNPKRGALTTFVTLIVRRQLNYDNATQTHVIHRPVNPRHKTPKLASVPYTTLHRTIDHRSPLDRLEQSDNSQALHHAIQLLKPRLKTVIVMRHFHNKTLLELATHFNLSRERIRNIETEALEELHELLKHQMTTI